MASRLHSIAKTLLLLSACMIPRLIPAETGVAQGQRTTLRAEKGNFAASIQVIGGQTAEIVLRKN